MWCPDLSLDDYKFHGEEMDDKVEYIEACLTQLDYIMRSINSRSFDIKNAIEWSKFTSGVL